MKDERGFLPILALGIGVVLLTGGTVTVSAANNSVPGEPLYGLDKALESFQIATSFSDTSKAATHLAIAEEKLSELEALQTKDKPAKDIAEAADELKQHEDAAGVEIDKAEKDGKDVEAITQRLAENSARQQQVLMNVAAKVPEQAQPAIQHAMESSQKGLTNAIQQQTKTHPQSGSDDTSNSTTESGNSTEGNESGDNASSNATTHGSSRGR